MSDEVCLVNIGPRGIRMRRMAGIVAGLFAIALVGAMVWLGLPRWTRLYAFAPFWLGALSWFQAQEKTCVRLAASGLRDLDGGPERIADDAELMALRAQARRVHLHALVTAAALTAASLALP